jgi:hypothetical protein
MAFWESHACLGYFWGYSCFGVGVFSKTDDFRGKNGTDRAERAAKAKAPISTQFTSKQQAFLDFVLSHYVSEGC